MDQVAEDCSPYADVSENPAKDLALGPGRCPAAGLGRVGAGRPGQPPGRRGAAGGQRPGGPGRRRRRPADRPGVGGAPRPLRRSVHRRAVRRPPALPGDPGRRQRRGADPLRPRPARARPPSATTSASARSPTAPAPTSSGTPACCRPGCSRRSTFRSGLAGLWIADRHHVWQDQGVSTEGGTKAVVAALTANIFIAVTKFGAWALTGASSMLAEAIHSVADSGNQVLLLVGGKRSPTGGHRRSTRSGSAGSATSSASSSRWCCSAWAACSRSTRRTTSTRRCTPGEPNGLLDGRWWWVPLVVLGAAIIAESLLVPDRDHGVEQGPRASSRGAGSSARPRRRSCR